MTLPAYNAAKHHIGLDGVGLPVVNGIRKEAAQPPIEKANDVGTQDFLGVSRHDFWTQSDYTGGEFQAIWNDPTMFSDCFSMLPDQLGYGLRTIPPIIDVQLGDAIAGATPMTMDVVDGVLYVVFNNAVPETRVYRFEGLDGTPTMHSETAAIDSGRNGTAAAWNLSSGRLWVGSNTGSSVPQIRTYAWDDTAAAGSRLVLKSTLRLPIKTDNTIQSCSGIHHFGKLRLMATRHENGEDNDHLWLYVNGTDAATKWDHVGILPGRFVSSFTYNNAVYILTKGADGLHTQLSMTQGDEVFPVLELPYFFEGRSMLEYAGALYIAGIGKDIAMSDAHGELYQVSGTSLRLVRTFASQLVEPSYGGRTVPDAQDPPGGRFTDAGRIPVDNPLPTPGSAHGQNGPVRIPDNAPKRPRKPMVHMKALAVAEGLLWMPDSSYTGLEVYDAVNDAFFGGPRLLGGPDTDIEFTRAIGFGGSIYLWGTGATQAKTGLYRVSVPDDTLLTSWNSFVTTSDFAPEPARLKVWSEFATVTRGQTPWVEWSTDSGETWTEVGPMDIHVDGDATVTKFDLASVPPSYRIRLRINFSQSNAVDATPPSLLGHTLGFIVRGIRRYGWNFAIPAVERPTGVDQSVTIYDPAEISDKLWELQMASDPVQFDGPDGRTYTVIVDQVVENQLVATGTYEAVLSVRLLEV